MRARAKAVSARVFQPTMSPGSRAFGAALLVVVSCAGRPEPHRAAIATATATATATTAAAMPVVSGRILDDEGHPLAAAWLRRMGRDGRVDALVIADADGRFAMPIDPDAGLVRLHASGPGRTSRSFVVVTDEAPISVEVKLGTEDAPTARPEDVLVGVVATFDDVVPVDASRSVPGGLEVTADLPDGSYAFLLMGTDAGKSFHVFADGMFELANGKALAPIDIAHPPPAGRSGQLALAAGSSSRAMNDLLVLARRSAWEELHAAATRIAATEARARVREAARIAYFLGGDLSSAEASAMATAIVSTVPPTVAAWSVVTLDDDLISGGHGHVSPFDEIVIVTDTPLERPFVRSFLDEQPDVGVVTRFVHEELLRARGSPDRQRSLVRESRAPRLREAPLAKQIAWLDPDRVLAPGKRAPVLDVPARDGKGRVGSATFAGRPFVVDIWKPACGPCVYEQPVLQRLSQRFGASGRVGFLGIMVGDGATTSGEDAGHPPPWKHGIVDPASMRALFAQLGAPVSFPLRILVDAKGRIVEAWPSFQGAFLDTMIESTLR